MSGTILGLLWTYVLSDMLIDLLNLFVVVFRLNNTYMGLTILGIGNALPDALTTIALAKKVIFYYNFLGFCLNGFDWMLCRIIIWFISWLWYCLIENYSNHWITIGFLFV